MPQTTIDDTDKEADAGRIKKVPPAEVGNETSLGDGFVSEDVARQILEANTEEELNDLAKRMEGNFFAMRSIRVRLQSLSDTKLLERMAVDSDDESKPKVDPKESAER